MIVVVDIRFIIGVALLALIGLVFLVVWLREKLRRKRK